MGWEWRMGSGEHMGSGVWVPATDVKGHGFEDRVMQGIFPKLSLFTQQ